MPSETHTGTAAEHEPEQPNSLKPEPGIAIWTVVTFVVLMVVLKKLAWGPILETLDKREKAIQEALAQAEAARAAAASSIEEQQRILAEARREAQALLAQSRADADRARDEATTRARTEADNIIASGREAIEQEKRAAIAELRTTTADLVVAAASKLIRARLDDAKSRELVQGYIGELEGMAGRGRTQA